MAGVSISISVDVDQLLALAVEIDEGCITQWIEARLDDARNHFVSSASGPSPSAPGAYPGLRTGQLVGSVSVQAGGRSGSMDAGASYASFLAGGTRKMAKRKMLAEALDESLSANPQTQELAQCAKFGAG